MALWGGLALALSPCARAQPVAPAILPPPRADEAARRIQVAFARHVPAATIAMSERDRTTAAVARGAAQAAGIVIDRPQLVLVVDRNPRVQAIWLVLA
ncbi:MAG: hypothetical protein JSR21_06625, partial [Proteobacteria bacterium]|nr:hypothetical protein [Pseudomonadota bacterium]